MVVAWLDDGTTNYEILTYIGEQGKYKTSFMTHLLPPALDKYFAIKHFNHTMSKDDRLALIELMGMYVKRPLSPKRVAFAMRRLGFEQWRTKSARGWNAVILTGDDIKNAQRQNARLSDAK